MFRVIAEDDAEDAFERAEQSAERAAQRIAAAGQRMNDTAPNPDETED